MPKKEPLANALFKGGVAYFSCLAYIFPQANAGSLYHLMWNKINQLVAKEQVKIWIT